MSISLKLANVKIRVNTDFARYEDFLKGYFEPVIMGNDAKGHDGLEINVKWHEGSLGAYLSTKKGANGYREIGASTVQGQRSFAAIRKIERKQKVLLECSLEGDSIKTNFMLLKKPFKDFFRYGPIAKAQDEWYFVLNYYFIYYPLFWYLEHFRKTHILHASAVSLNNKGIVICGLENMGKTSLSLKFLQEPEAEFLSDNLVFFDQKNVYPCYELVRIHKNEEEGLWKDHFQKSDRFQISKDLFQPKNLSTTSGVSVQTMIFPEFGKEFTVKSLNAQEAAQKAILLSHLPSELSNYAEYRNLYNLMDLTTNPWAAQGQVLKGLLVNSKCFSITMNKSEGLNKNFDLVKSAIS